MKYSGELMPVTARSVHPFVGAGFKPVPEKTNE